MNLELPDEELKKVFDHETEARKNYTIEQSIEAYKFTSNMVEKLENIMQELGVKILHGFAKALGEKLNDKVEHELHIANIKYVRYMFDCQPYDPSDKEPRIVVCRNIGLYDKQYHPKISSILKNEFDDDDLLSLKERAELYEEEKRKNTEDQADYEQYLRLKKKFEKN